MVTKTLFQCTYNPPFHIRCLLSLLWKENFQKLMVLVLPSVCLYQ